MASSSKQRLEVRSLSASNLPNVRKLKTTRMKCFVVVTGPEPRSYRTNVDEDGGCNPSWDDPFTISLQPGQPDAVLEFNLRISRSLLGEKRVGRAHVPVADFSDPNGDTKVYPIECVDHDRADAKLTISAKLKQDEGASSSTPGGRRTGQKSSPTGQGKTTRVSLKGQASTKPSGSRMKRILKRAATTAAEAVAAVGVAAFSTWADDHWNGNDDEPQDRSEDEDDQQDNNDDDDDHDEGNGGDDTDDDDDE